MSKWKVEHERPGCIACGACAAIFPDEWTMSDADGKSDLVHGEKVEEGGEVVLEKLEIPENHFEKHKEAAESCPVNVIHLIDKDSGKKLI